ncbi:MAG: DUF4148 domain-containing protein [Nitrosopumilales archaeon]|nr:MAG: DUF4148 domain-containing protein [Nitrosopumilales archaeon]
MNKKHIISILVILAMLSVGCIAATTSSSTQTNVVDDTRAEILSQQDYRTDGYLSGIQITVLHYKKYGVTCFAMRGTSSSAGMSCFKDSDITGV